MVCRMRKTNDRGTLPWQVAVAGCVVLFGIGCRVAALDNQGYWHDEIYSIAHLSGFDTYVLPGSDLSAIEEPRPAGEWVRSLNASRYQTTIGRNLIHEGHPPLYQLGLKAWTQLFGDSLWGVRSFSLFPALLTIPLLFLLGLLLWGTRAGLAAAALIAISPFHVYFSVEARNYSWAILFAGTALLAIIALWREGSTRRPSWQLVWWIGVLGACYTHYYAGLYCGTLLLIAVCRWRSLRDLVRLGAPFVLVLPWLLVLRLQLNLPQEHWTAGAPSLSQAALGVLRGILDQMTGPFSSATGVERALALAVIVYAVALIVRRQFLGARRIPVEWLFVSVPLFAVFVLGVDLVTDHHTITVSRYLSSGLPVLVLLAAAPVALQPRFGLALVSLLALGNVAGSLETIEGERAPKQMIREAAGFIAQRHSRGDDVFVTPSGPTLIGLALHLPPEIEVGALPPDYVEPVTTRLTAQGNTVWLVRQNLGVSAELTDAQLQDLGGRVTHFAGIDVMVLEPPSSR